MYCVDCGSQFQEEAAFCGKCGAQRGSSRSKAQQLSTASRRGFEMLFALSAEPPLEPAAQFSDYERERLREYWTRSLSTWTRAARTWKVMLAVGIIAIVFGLIVAASGFASGGITFVALGALTFMSAIPILGRRIPRGIEVSERFLDWLDGLV
jgi:hypothetical protein